MRILAIYDNGGKTADRYTVYFDIPEKIQDGKQWYQCLGMDNSPFHPQGIGMHSSGQLGRHNGKRIAFKELPFDCQRAVMQDFIGEIAIPLKKLKRRSSWWRHGFAGKKYSIKAIDIMDETREPVFVLKTGESEIDYHLCNFDEIETL